MASPSMVGAPTIRRRDRSPARRGRVAVLALVMLVQLPLAVATATSASAHPVSTSAVLLDIGTDAVTGEIELPVNQVAIALDEPITADTVTEPSELDHVRQYVQAHVGATTTDGGRAWTVTVTGGRVESIDDIDHVVFDLTMLPPTGTVGDFTLRYDVIVEHLLSHHIFVSARAGEGGDYTNVGMLDWNDSTIAVSVSDFTPGVVTGFLSSVRLGFTHISGGADHLLFLLMLLLPAPLVAVGGRWMRSSNVQRDCWRVVHVVTAFAIGHSITLILGALGLVQLPTRVVESLIALSVVVSGVHAIRPLVRGREAWIAGLFGLMHGLAFATLLGELGLTQQSLVVDLLGFNVGIELTQLAVVALVLPSLLVLSRTAWYTPIRLTLATAGTALALGWLAERLTLIPSNPLEPWADGLVAYPLVCATALAAVATAAWWRHGRREPSPFPVSPAGTASLLRAEARTSGHAPTAAVGGSTH